MIHSLGSHTSGVDGSSEGGRINTVSIPGALVIYGVALLQRLQRGNPKLKMGAGPVLVDGMWRLELTYQGDQPPAGAPERWHGHRVVLKKVEPPPPPAPPPAPPQAAAPKPPK